MSKDKRADSRKGIRLISALCRDAYLSEFYSRRVIEDLVALAKEFGDERSP
jgi:hypothetical protein